MLRNGSEVEFRSLIVEPVEKAGDISIGEDYLKGVADEIVGRDCKI